MPTRLLAAVWLVASVASAVRLAVALPQPAGSERTDALSDWHLPGETTHGHYQIELKCQACHDRGGGVREQSCVDCHGAALKAGRDTHPKSKFDDPSNAHLLTVLDARSCLACHEEHVADRIGQMAARADAPMGVSVPQDFCWQCHEDVADDRPSHVGLAFDTCSNVGCHNYHDNTALYENFLAKHLDEPSVLDDPRRPPPSRPKPPTDPLTPADQDAPPEVAARAGQDGRSGHDEHVLAWSQSGHAAAGVNCTACHQPEAAGATSGVWSDAVATATCAGCHASETDGWHDGLHGMRPAAGLEPMRPELARLAMRPEVAGVALDCNVCHGPHRADTQLAAADSCLTCHDDTHSRAWSETTHAVLWRDEQSALASGDDSLAGTGVSCATCHLPRTEDGVEHNQSATLQPREKMVRTVCLDCHGAQFALDAMADPDGVATCYGQPPAGAVDSLEMVRRWFEQKAARRSGYR